ncbi:unnamed protein product [Brachionus calyciflorus]|uniref:Calpain catalytic domain-containing protein n=1 Tax=Brachionus calyciflorus TaxID=104777 RepID=A0A814GU71_9BILA|nr:unnamed protein product [Brachionus calyciflorus]
MSQIKPFYDQDYQLLKSHAKSSKQLFCDEKFPANDSSIFRFKNFLGKPVSWKRPSQIVSDPKFIVNKIDPNDLDQGRVGDCWMIAAASCVLSSPELIERTIPTNQTFDSSDYAGIFHFRFWVNGEWVDVVVDDLLPVDENNQLLFCKNLVEKNEMYGPLLEKAYAKLNICYEFLIVGYPHDALVDFTGGVNEVYNLKFCRSTASANEFIDPNKLWEILYKTVSYGSLSIGTIVQKDGYAIGAVLPNGLVISLAYSIMNVFELIESNGSFDQIRKFGSKKPTEKTIKLLRLRSPFGKNNSYNGPWSKGTQEWNKLSEKAKKELNAQFQEDGHFFISYEDFIQNIDFLSICHVNINGLSNEGNFGETNWELKMFKGEWIVGKNAGGSGNEINFWTNPQHKFSIKDSNKSLLVSVSQEGISKKRFQTQGQFTGMHEALGFYIYAIKSGAQADTDGRYNQSNLTLFNYTKVFKYQKEVSMRLEIQPGDYVIFPCCFIKDKPGSYVLRIYTQSNSNLEQDDNDNYPGDNVNPVVDERDLYDRLYYRGMDKNQIEEINNQAKENVSKACSIM